VLATDYDFATSRNCTELPNLVNNADYAKNLTKLSSQLKRLKYIGNLTNAVYAA
jgi:hypothetical protein